MTAAKRRTQDVNRQDFEAPEERESEILFFYCCFWLCLAVLGSVQFMFSEMELFLISWRMHM